MGEAILSLPVGRAALVPLLQPEPGGSQVEAGAPVHISVAARDRFGNLTPKLRAWQTFVVSADGASETPVAFTADEKGLSFAAPLTVAGVYSVTVALQVCAMRHPTGRLGVQPRGPALRHEFGGLGRQLVESPPFEWLLESVVVRACESRSGKTGTSSPHHYTQVSPHLVARWALQDKKQGGPESNAGTSVAGSAMDDARSVRTGVAGGRAGGGGLKSHRTSVAGSVMGERRPPTGARTGPAGSVAGSMASRAAAARKGSVGRLGTTPGSLGTLTPGLSADALEALNQSLAAIALPGWPRRIQVLLLASLSLSLTSHSPSDGGSLTLCRRACTRAGASRQV